MGLWDTIKGAVKTISSPVTDAVRGLGRLVRGDFRRGAGDVLGLFGMTNPMISGAASAIRGDGFGSGLTEGLKRLGIYGGLGAGAGLLGLGGGSGGLGGALGALTAGGDGGGLSMLGKLLLGGGATALNLHGASQQNKAAERWNQGLLGLLTSGIEKAEGAYDARAPLRSASYDRITRGLSGGGDIFSMGSGSPGMQTGDWSITERAPSPALTGLRETLDKKKKEFKGGI